MKKAFFRIITCSVLFAGLFSSCTTTREASYAQKSQMDVPSYIDKDSVLLTPMDVDVNHKRYTVLGEGGPGVFPINQEKINIFQALAQADTAAHVDRSKNEIIIIREIEPQTLMMARFNLRNEDIIHSEYYYIEDNDIIYIQPMTKKMFSTIGTLFRK